MTFKKKLLPLLYLLLPYASAQCKGPKTPDDYIRDVFLNPSDPYSKRTRPNVALLQALNNTSTTPTVAEPDVITLSLKFIAVKGMNLRDSEFEATYELTQTWIDSRLAFDQYCLPKNQPIAMNQAESTTLLWLPNVNLRNKVDNVKTLEYTTWVHGNGTVQQKHLFIGRTSCNLDLRQFPYDTQKCDLLYGSRDSDIGETQLKESKKVEIELWEQVYPTSEEFTILSASSSSSNSNIFFSISVARESQYYFQFVIIPVLLMVIISWSSLFINRAAAPARVTLSIICFLTISNFISGQFTVLPKLPSRVWLLSYMFISLAYAFVPVVEYVACNYLFRVERRLDMVRKSVREKKLLEAEQFKMDMESSGIGATMSKKDKMRSLALNSDRNVKTAVNVNKKDMIAYGVCRIDKIMLGRNGYMRFKDQHLDIFFRWAYPITYAIALGILVAIIGIRK